MKGALFSESYRFLNISRSEYNYTDQRCGSPMNFVAYMKKGRCRIVSPEFTIEPQEGDVFFIPKNLSYRSYWYGSPEIEFVSLAYWELNTSDNGNFELQIIKADEGIIDKILSVPTGDGAITCKALSIFYSLMSDVIPLLRESPDSGEKALVREAVECIRKNPFSSVSQIAQMCRISESYLYAIFKKSVYSTPNNYRQKVLCDMGIELLLTTDKKIEEIAEMAGFSSGSYFRKVLKKQVGYTPREVRRGKL